MCAVGLPVAVTKPYGSFQKRTLDGGLEVKGQRLYFLNDIKTIWIKVARPDDDVLKWKSTKNFTHGTDNAQNTCHMQNCLYILITADGSELMSGLCWQIIVSLYKLQILTGGYLCVCSNWNGSL